MCLVSVTPFRLDCANKQVIVGSFVVDKKSNSNSAVKSAPGAPQPQMLNFGGPMAAASPSQGDSSESSDENGNSHLARGSGFYNNSQPLHNMQMYRQLWAGQTQQWSCIAVNNTAHWGIDVDDCSVCPTDDVDSKC